MLSLNNIGEHKKTVFTTFTGSDNTLYDCLANRINRFVPITIQKLLLPIKQLPFRHNVDPAPLPETL